MTTKLRNALVSAVGILAALLVALFSGALDDVLRNLGVSIAGRPPVASGQTDVPAAEAPKPVPDPAAAVTSEQARERVVPIFDLVRVEPTGDAVIAGQGIPDAKVEILSGDGVIASGQANATGEWAIVLSDPLKAGAHDITVRAIAPDGNVLTSDQSVAVSVPDGGKGEVLVVLNQPGAASTVLQIPGLEEAQKKLAEAGSTPPDATVADAGQAAEGGAAAPQADATPAAPAADPAVAEAPAAAAQQPAAQQPDTTPAPATATAPTTAPAPATAAPPATAETTAAEPSANPPAGAAEQPSTAQAPTAATPPSGEPAAPAEPAAPPASGGTSVAVGGTGETTTVSSSSSGTAPVDPSAAAPAKPATTDVAQAPAAQPPASATAASPSDPAAPAPADPAASAAPAAAVADVEAQLKSSAPGDLAGEAGSPVVFGTEPAASATDPSASAAAEQQPVAAPAEPAKPATAAAPEPAPPVPVTVEAVELENGRTFFAAGAAGPNATIRVYVDGKPVADVVAKPTGRWLLQTELPLAPGNHSVRADQIGADGSVVVRAEVPFDIAEELPAAPTGASGTGQVAAGTGIAGEARVGQSRTMIIREGDNLWRIARRLYGRGVRYTTIYQANTDQIRNPDLIYPGQVFVLPEGDTAWTELVPAAPAAPAN